MLANPTDSGVLGSPSASTITIVDNDLPAETTSLTEVAYPGPAPAADNGLRVVLEPASAGGQWRLRWETAWRPSGSALLGLVAGNYDLEFRPAPDYLQPGNLVVPVSGGSLVTITNVYDRTLTPAVGSLRVILEPSALATAANEVERAQWRLRGESFWRNSAEVITTLAVGEHVIEFKSVIGYETPRPRVASVAPNQLTEWAVTYWLASVSPGTGPSVIPDHGSIMGELLSGYPYAYAGQLLTDAGYGTGFVVKRRVVLTAAHVVFNDASLSFVKQSWWFFQRHRDDFDPIPQTPRGWYVFEGYAAQRARDASPGVSSPASQNLDAAALYFLEDAGRGGYGGYLVSETEPNTWLLGSVQKLLVGYPVEGVPETDRGRMHRVAPMNYSFEPIGNQVYRTTGLKSYAGNSGGPLCVLYPNGRYYPAAIYLGGSGQSVVRAIDPDVVDLINRAEITASTGDNQVGGGAESFGPRDDQTGFAPGRLQVDLGPANRFGRRGRLALGRPRPRRLRAGSFGGLFAGAGRLHARIQAGRRLANPTQPAPNAPRRRDTNAPSPLSPARARATLPDRREVDQPGTTIPLRDHRTTRSGLRPRLEDQSLAAPLDSDRHQSRRTQRPLALHRLRRRLGARPLLPSPRPPLTRLFRGSRAKARSDVAERTRPAAGSGARPVAADGRNADPLTIPGQPRPPQDRVDAVPLPTK